MYNVIQNIYSHIPCILTRGFGKLGSPFASLEQVLYKLIHALLEYESVTWFAKGDRTVFKNCL